MRNAGSVRTAVDWLFRSRVTGRITIAQFPNLPLALFIVAGVAQWLLDPAGRVDTALTVVGTAGLLGWAADELVRGVNPWRRLLGGSVLALQLFHAAA